MSFELILSPFPVHTLTSSFRVNCERARNNYYLYEDQRTSIYYLILQLAYPCQPSSEQISSHRVQASFIYASICME